MHPATQIRRIDHAPQRVSLPRFVAVAASVFLFVGLGAFAASEITGRELCISAYFQGPATLWLVAMAFFEFALARIVLRQFSKGEPMQPAWFLIMLSAGCHLTGAIFVQILSTDSVLNPLTYTAQGRFGVDQEALHRFGLMAGGPLQMLFLAGGLALTLRWCRRSGLSRQHFRSDWFLLLLVALAVCLEIFHLATEVFGGRLATAYDMLTATSGPLEIILVIEAGLLQCYMRVMGGGLIARCWTMFSFAILLSAGVNLGAWMAESGYLPVWLPWMTWYVRFLSATACALAPAWQIEAIQHACGEVGVSRFSPFASSLAALRLIQTKG
jgi:hypothetical protein